jgi:hypothetical protein
VASQAEQLPAQSFDIVPDHSGMYPRKTYWVGNGTYTFPSDTPDSVAIAEMNRLLHLVSKKAQARLAILGTSAAQVRQHPLIVDTSQPDIPVEAQRMVGLCVAGALAAVLVVRFRVRLGRWLLDCWRFLVRSAKRASSLPAIATALFLAYVGAHGMISGGDVIERVGLLRIVVTGISVWIAIEAKDEGRRWPMYAAVALALAFNPFLRLHASWQEWLQIDLAPAAVLLGIAWMMRRPHQPLT